MILNFIIDFLLNFITRIFYLSQYQSVICADNTKYFNSREYVIYYNIYILTVFHFSYKI